MIDTRYEITLKVPVTVTCATGGDVVFSEIQRYISDSGWRDGRYPFPREMLAEALAKLLRQSVFESVLRFFETRHGNNTTIQLDENTTMNAAYSKTEEWILNDLKRISVEMDGWRASAKKSLTVEKGER